METASPGNQHCVSGIGALSFPTADLSPQTDASAVRTQRRSTTKSARICKQTCRRLAASDRSRESYGAKWHVRLMSTIFPSARNTMI